MIREYKDIDFLKCAEIVNKVWDFDAKFRPKQLSELLKKMYTGSSLAASNFNVVAVENDVVKGFLFGNCGTTNLHKNEYGGVLGGFRFLFRLFSMEGIDLRKKMYYLRILGEHEKERRKIESRRENEVNLFAVDPDVQGKGYGKLLMNSFVDYCRKQNVTRITLDTDKECNLGFYNHFGFKVKGEFYSALQMEYSGTSGDSYVYELEL